MVTRYTTSQGTDGNYEVFDNGSRIVTGTKQVADSYLAQNTPDAPVVPTKTDTGSGAADTGVRRYTSAYDTEMNQYGTGAKPTSFSDADTEAVRTKIGNDMQNRIDAIDTKYVSIFAKDAQDANERLGENRATRARGGLLGSERGNAQKENVVGLNKKVADATQSAKQAEINSVYDRIDARADAEIQSKRAEASSNAQDYQDYLKTRREEARTDIKTLGAGGISLADIDKNDLAELKKDAGIQDDVLFEAYLNANRPKDLQTAYTYKTVGDQLIAYGVDPKTNQLTTLQTKLPFNVPDGYKTVATDDGRFLFVPETIDPSRSLDDQVKVFGDKSEYSKPAAGTGDNPDYNGDFSATVDLVAQAGTTNAQREQIRQNMQKFLTAGDYGSAYTQVLKSVSNSLTGTPKTDFENQISSYGALDELRSALQEAAAAGISTNLFQGTADKIQNKIGALVTDPKYAALATRLDSAFQQYRLNMTGAAFGAQESGEYASVIPSKSNTLDLNLAKLDGASQYLNSQIDATIQNHVGVGGVNIKKKAEQGSTGSGSGITATGPNGETYEFDELSPEEKQTLIDAGYEF